MEDVQKSYQREKIRKTIASVKTLRLFSLLMDFEECVDKNDENIISKAVDQLIDVIFWRIPGISPWTTRVNEVLESFEFTKLLTSDGELSEVIEATRDYYCQMGDVLLAKCKKNDPVTQQFQTDIRGLMDVMCTIESMVEAIEYLYTGAVSETSGNLPPAGGIVNRLMTITESYALTAEMLDFISTMQDLLEAPELINALKRDKEFFEDYSYIIETSSLLEKQVLSEVEKVMSVALPESEKNSSSAMISSNSLWAAQNSKNSANILSFFR